MNRFSFKVGSQPALVVRLTSGTFDLTNGPEGEVTVDVGGTGAEYVAVEQAGDTIIIREERRLFGHRSASIRVAVPPGAALEAASASLEIMARVDLGRVVARTASGELNLGRVSTAEIKSASGDIKIDSCTGRCDVTSASGDVRVHVVDGDLSISTASGDIAIERSAGRIETKTASGDIQLGVCTGSTIEASSMSGDVELGIPEGTRVEAEIDSLSGTVTLPPRRSPEGETARQMRLRIKTVSGDIDIRRVSRT